MSRPTPWSVRKSPTGGRRQIHDADGKFIAIAISGDDDEGVAAQIVEAVNGMMAMRDAAKMPDPGFISA